MHRLLLKGLGVVAGHPEGYTQGPLGREHVRADGVSRRLGGRGFFGHGLRLEHPNNQFASK